MRPIAATVSRSPFRSPPLDRFFIAGLSAAAILAALLAANVASAAEYNPARTRPAASEQNATQRVIVKFRDTSRLSTQATANGESATAAVDTTRVNALASRIRFTVQASRALSSTMHVMQIAPLTNNETAAETLARLRADSDVEFAELDRRVYPHATSNDPLATGQWYLQAAQSSAINANAAWDTTKGHDGVVIAVVDTGVRFDHPDLGRASAGGRFLAGYDFVSQDGNNDFSTANDGNGRDADPSDPGDNCGSDNSSWHGTRVSGIIGALTDNSVGVAGIMWDGYILPVRVLGRCGGFNSDVVAGIRWAAGLNVPGVPTNPNPAQVINVSLGGEGPCDSASGSAINEVSAAGVLVVVSAGNEGGPVDSPANCPGAMGIVGLRHRGTKVGFSSLGPQIALGAPGGNCVNTGAGQPCLFSIDTTSNGGAAAPGASTYTDQLDTNVGTSFSSPIVSGIAGLMLAVNGNLKSSQLIKRMQDGSTKPFPTTSDTGTPPVCHVPVSSADIQALECSCTTSTCGAGMANANGAVNEALRPIAAVLTPTSVSAGQNVSLQATGSAAACGRTVSSYAWTVVSGTAALTNANTNTVGLTAPTSGTVTVRVTVTDDAGRTDAADVVVSPTSATTTAPSNAGTKACLTAVVPPAGISIAASDASASEAGAQTGAFTLTRTGSTAAALQVTLAMTGTATAGTDYQAITTAVTIPAGSGTAVVTVTPTDDTVFEGDETVIATIQTSSTLEIGTNTATVTITDNESAPPPSNSDGGGGGGGGALDLLTLLAAMGFAAHAVLRRRRAAPVPRTNR
jgi:serine protease